MTLAVKQADVEWFLQHVPGATPAEVEMWKGKGEIVIEDEKNEN